MPSHLLDDLRSFLDRDQIAASDAILDQHARGESFDQAVRPEVVAFPKSTEEVAEILRYASQHGVPVTPVAVNSSLEGHTVPLHGGISLDLARMDRILAFRPEDLLVVVQPAVTYPQVNMHTRRSGLFFPVDPGAHASIGGMIATNASGTAAVRYGVTADYVLALEVVTPSGEVIRTGSQARKSSSGYNLSRLMCGSEGTLGVITEATLRLSGLPEAAAAARVPFVTIEAATHFATAIIQAGMPVARCELVDAASIAAINTHQDTEYPVEPTTFLEFHGNGPGVEADVAVAADLAETMGATAFEASHDEASRERLWEARHNLFYALVAANPGARNITTDVAVPISKLPYAVDRALISCEREGLGAYVLGHVGDGNVHLCIFYRDGPEAEAVERVSHAMVMHALESGGTATGEHGVGIRKLKYMAAEHGPALPVMQSLKRVLDPAGIMNPGKKLPD